MTFNSDDIHLVNRILCDSQFKLKCINKLKSEETLNIDIVRPDYERIKVLKFCNIKIFTIVYETKSILNIFNITKLKIKKKDTFIEFNEHNFYTIYSISFINNTVIIESDNFEVEMEVTSFFIEINDIKKTQTPYLRIFN